MLISTTDPFKNSKDISALMVYVALVVESGRVHHCLSVRNASPYVSFYIFPKLDWILFHLFYVPQLSCSISVPNAFIVSRVKRVTLLKRSKQWLFLYLLFLLWESNLSAEGRKVRLETTSLAHSIRPGLVTMED